MKPGTTVKLVYTGTLDDGTVFGVATEEQPMEFQTGMDLTIPGFEKEILEMSEVGEERTFTVNCYDAYGEYHEEFIQEVPKENIPMSVKVGKRIWMFDDDGNKFPVTVMEVKDQTVVFDMNHPLAGKDLTFNVKILELQDAPENFVTAAEKQQELDRQAQLLGINNGQESDTNTIML